MEHHKKNIWPRGDSNLRHRSQSSTDMLYARPSRIPKKVNDILLYLTTLSSFLKHYQSAK